ncbi:hypothetical protein NPIL_951 [Nephila pilipes]|uniref:Uncharacterized protein n=1 Tax=Nephila pilipes TaxID=299642 RepID=A0A8X6P0X7_NEPPI|nr:hypothetical protein NPIL_375091 [Nephila pilipes]GFT18836.1 hypothetical protein NPIL_196311 [Nephila pilipes]GFT44742.1 hypothetical protein NPIL_145661 [Nephila pilipes]GFT96060.1 hypothetical protein NPIL_951 [Nephila pilipes]
MSSKILLVVPNVVLMINSTWVAWDNSTTLKNGWIVIECPKYTLTPYLIIGCGPEILSDKCRFGLLTCSLSNMCELVISTEAETKFITEDYTPPIRYILF